MARFPSLQTVEEFWFDIKGLCSSVIDSSGYCIFSVRDLENRPAKLSNIFVCILLLENALAMKIGIRPSCDTFPRENTDSSLVLVSMRSA